VAVDGGANIFGGVVEVAGEFDFFVADGGDLGESAVEILLHLIAHGIELHADVAKLAVGCGPTEAARKKSGGGDGSRLSEKSAACGHGVSPVRCGLAIRIIRREV
jgi:hypothetical protein